MTEASKIKEELKYMLSEKRFEHSLAVAQRAEELALIYECSTDKAYIAGLVHDSCKEISKQEQLKIIQRFDIEMTEIEKKEPNIWHGYAASGYISEKWGIYDTDIRNAVKYHTCGRKGMSVLEKIIFIADLTSLDRKYSDSQKIKEMSENDLNLAIYNSYLYIIPFVIGRRGMLTQNTVECYNDAVSHLSEKEMIL